MLRRLAFGGPTVLLQLRFDQSEGGEPRSHVRYRRLPESMQPKLLDKNFTPFPLPKYDEDLGYGPVRLHDIPDIERAKQRHKKVGLELMETPLQNEPLEFEETAPSTLTTLSSSSESLTKESMAAVSADNNINNTSHCRSDDDRNALSGYSLSCDYPLIDRLECNRSLDDLLLQFVERPQTEARSASLVDMASTISKRSDEELVRMFSEISTPFGSDGRGPNFLGTKVSKFGRPYHVSTTLLSAYVNLLDAATTVFLVEQPWRLVRSPALTIQLLHFMALFKVFEPNKWFTFSDHAPSNRADYKHPRGVNGTTAFWGTGEEIFDFIVHLVRREEGGVNSPLLEACTDEQLVELLNGFSAVMPNLTAIGSVFNSIMEVFLHRIRRLSNGFSTWQESATVERMYLTSVLSDAGSEDLLRFLLSDTSFPRGADFFAAVSRRREADVHQKAVARLQEAIDEASKRCEASTTLALLESGSELLLSLANKNAAYEFAMRNQFDHLMLRSFKHCSVVADRLRDEQTRISSRIPTSLDQLQSQMLTCHATKMLSSSCSAPSASSAPDYVFLRADRRFTRPLMTMLSQLDYLNDMDTVFLLHSSLMKTSTDQLVTAVRRLLSGKDSLIVTMSCLRELSVRSITSPKVKEREACEQALEIIAYELEKGRAVLVPFTEEILLHDAGVYCDEDLMLWSIAAFFARELPLVKVNTLIHRDNIARTPYRFLKGGLNPFVSPHSLYDKDAPLLSSLHSKELNLVTRNVQLKTAVRDRKCRLHNYNPVRARFVYRRDKALFDKYHVTARNLAPGFSRGALQHDWRGLGVYTPDHPQVPYKPRVVVDAEKDLSEIGIC